MPQIVSKWFVYMIKAKNEHLYTGITTDPLRRFSEHQYGKKGAKYFNSTEPDLMVFVQEVSNRSEASKLEANIKKLKRIDKLKLINSVKNQHKFELLEQ